MEKDIIQGTLSGARHRGRQKATWVDNVTSWTDFHLEDVLHPWKTVDRR